MVSFRRAGPSHYIKLLTIRFLICPAAGCALYGQLASFHIRVPLAQIAALTPLIVAIGNAPFSPGGIGTTQLVFTIGFAGFAGKSDLFALSLAVSGFNLLVRIPMGLAMRAPLEEAVELRREFRLERVDSGNGLPANPAASGCHCLSCAQADLLCEGTKPLSWCWPGCFPGFRSALSFYG